VANRLLWHEGQLAACEALESMRLVGSSDHLIQRMMTKNRMRKTAEND
jgi:biotin carboxylase